MTELVRKKKGAMTLGIGDGANDVGMIQVGQGWLHEGSKTTQVAEALSRLAPVLTMA